MGSSQQFLPGEVGFFPAGNWPDSFFILCEDVAFNLSAEPSPSHEVKGSQGFSSLKKKLLYVRGMKKEEREHQEQESRGTLLVRGKKWILALNTSK